MQSFAQHLRCQAIEILLVEDNPGDVRLIREAFRDSKTINQLHAVPDGNEALAYLRKEGAYRSATRPNLILLDLNLPRMDGRDVLSELKADPQLRGIPVVIVTSSKVQEDIVKSYDHQANCYITKPLDLEKFFEVVKAIEYFWVSIVELPRK